MTMSRFWRRPHSKSSRNPAKPHFHAEGFSPAAVVHLHPVSRIFTNPAARTRKGADRSVRETQDLAARLLHAQEEERRQIAREMHDDWTQRLAVLAIDLARLEKHLGDRETQLLLAAIQEQTVRLSEDVHALSRQLHPSILDDLGLVGALCSECACFSRRERIRVVYLPEEVPASVPREGALCLYRVAQEALRNVAKHAAVKEASVSLAVIGSELVLRVQDKGLGFDPAGQHSGPGLGLSSMRERALLVQAVLSIASAPGQGTTIELRVPLDRSVSPDRSHP
jgi:signal transduction histidine kinase